MKKTTIRAAAVMVLVWTVLFSQAGYGCEQASPLQKFLVGAWTTNNGSVMKFFAGGDVSLKQKDGQHSGTYKILDEKTVKISWNYVVGKEDKEYTAVWVPSEPNAMALVIHIQRSPIILNRVPDRTAQKR